MVYNWAKQVQKHLFGCKFEDCNRRGIKKPNN